MMSDTTKITLSAKELELVCNTDWILTKHVIIKKVTALFGELIEKMQQFTTLHRQYLPMETFINTPKISKGENYKQLPYVLLDYPRYFNKENILAIRTMFWWGNFFSVTLHLSGKITNDVIPGLTANFLQLQQQDYWLCINNEQWQHHFEKDNYVAVKSLTYTEFEQIIKEKPFVKISKKISLQHWDTAVLFAEQSFKEIIELLKINYPNGEKDL